MTTQNTHVLCVRTIEVDSLGIIKYMYDHGCPHKMDTIHDRAIEYDRLEILKYLHTLEPKT